MTTYHTLFSGLCGFAVAPRVQNGQVTSVQVLFTDGSSAHLPSHDPYLLVPEACVMSFSQPDFVVGSSQQAFAAWQLRGFRLRYPPGTQVDWAVKGLFDISTAHHQEGSDQPIATNRSLLKQAASIAGLIELRNGTMTGKEPTTTTICYKNRNGKPASKYDPHPPLCVQHEIAMDRPLFIELIPMSGTDRIRVVAVEQRRNVTDNPAVQLQISNYQRPSAQPTDPQLAFFHFVAHYDLLQNLVPVDDRFYPMEQTSPLKPEPTIWQSGQNCFRGPLMAALSGTIETAEHVHGR